ncbi:MAG: ribosome small subunit-dependent GTPase A [Selenomonadaceae bacterium]|nr:ribosome small subunit-dependent GTPase A [Selenomonadaceae bacterium]
MKGRIIRAQNSFFYVKTDDGVFETKLRGKMKQSDEVLMGDYVEFTPLSKDSGVIENVETRKNYLMRPKVANVDAFCVVFAVKSPDPHPLLITRFLVLGEFSRIPEIFICANKSDLATCEMFLPFIKAGYEVVFTSAENKEGIEALRKKLRNKTTVFAGSSGVGKSSLLNAVDETFKRTTGNVSEKIKRGKHTTRYAEFLPFENGYIVDTPGFSSVDLNFIKNVELDTYFKEFIPFLGKCYFSPCSHSHEPKCAVKEAVKEGKIQGERYDAYLKLLEEIDS